MACGINEPFSKGAGGGGSLVFAHDLFTAAVIAVRVKDQRQVNLARPDVGEAQPCAFEHRVTPPSLTHFNRPESFAFGSG